MLEVSASAVAGLRGVREGCAGVFGLGRGRGGVVSGILCDDLRQR